MLENVQRSRQGSLLPELIVIALRTPWLKLVSTPSFAHDTEIIPLITAGRPGFADRIGRI